ncbi:LytR/AlgR family response regulator transcription factor [Sediminicoccus rosea]|uniref:LytTR family DNA-binding domain-containing protein n=1 Tax=Sediminicoccus rosea TaxID=1225128 RepID=A0ABZ0PP22_9PROT|nr:LytTR family DNA-binding domain-containing protein [Sediminicoccus rosea]WPB87494.1 LytTR family DNA-binding domain-containing protein [Sediminicoccus rosea]
MLRAVIVDDEPLAIRALRRLLLAHPEVEVVATADSLATAVEAIARTRPDLVLLDIELGAGDGFDVLARVTPAPRVIFVTAHPQHAVQAFAVEAADYLLKPVLPERLAAALARVARQIAPAPAPLGPAVELRMPSRTIFADPGELVALSAEGDFTRVHLADQPALLILRTLSHFETLLPAPPFLRAGRSLLLNLQRVRRVEAEGRNLAHVTMEGLEARLPLGRVAAARLRGALAGRAG